jgi:hypothetical protein
VAYRGQNDSQGQDLLRKVLDDIELRLRRLEGRQNPAPDPGWRLVEVGDKLHYLYVPTGSTGPVIGTK